MKFRYKNPKAKTNKKKFAMHWVLFLILLTGISCRKLAQGNTLTCGITLITLDACHLSMD